MLTSVVFMLARTEVTHSAVTGHFLGHHALSNLCQLLPCTQQKMKYNSAN